MSTYSYIDTPSILHVASNHDALIKFRSVSINPMGPRQPNRNSVVTGKSACPVIRGVFSRQIGAPSHARRAAENGRCLLTGRFNAPLPERFTRAASFACFGGPSAVYIALDRAINPHRRFIYTRCSDPGSGKEMPLQSPLSCSFLEAARVVPLAGTGSIVGIYRAKTIPCCWEFAFALGVSYSF